MQIIGLTGGIGCGKSTAAAYLRDRAGIPVIDADKIARRLLEQPDTTAYRAVCRAFPEAVDSATGLLSRPGLAAAAFSSPVRRRRLEAIVHPAVKRDIVLSLLLHWVCGSPRVVLDIPLLYETGLHRFMSYVVVVSASHETQVRRVVGRQSPPISRPDAERRIAAQMSLAEKCRRAHVVIDNEGSVEDLHAQLEARVVARRPSRVVHIGVFLLFPLGLFLFAVYSRVFMRL